MSTFRELPRFMVSATHKSSGKTTISIGLCRALAQRGRVVQAFKKGPDYIDPMWLAAATGRPCRNLDPYLVDGDEDRRAFLRHAANADLCVVEANKGLFDGVSLDGCDSNAAVAKALGLPVLLVIDARGMTRGVAPLLLGYQAFDRDVRIAGVILNQVGGARHEAKLRRVIEHYTDVPVIGAVHRDERLAMVERHIGLVPSAEADGAEGRIAAIAAAVAAQVDLDAVLGIAHAAPPVGRPDAAPTAPRAMPEPDVRIGVVQDRAFNFYYADDFDALRAAGAQLVSIDALADTQLPDIDGLFIGGGFPEVFAAELEANHALRTRLRSAIEGGLPVYAECGGLMYLARSVTWQGRTHRMVGALPGDAVMHPRPVGRGYVELAETSVFPWGGASARRVRAHEFHHSRLENLPADACFAYDVKRGYGIDGRRDGLVVRNVLASYAHLRSAGAAPWAHRFVAFVRGVNYRRRGQDNVVYLASPRTREPVEI